MRTLVIDMPSGLAGDMLLAGLIACGADPVSIAARLDGLGIGVFGLNTAVMSVGHIEAHQVDFSVVQEAQWSPLARPSSDHAHRPYREIRALIAGAALPARVQLRAQAVFAALAAAEGKVHGVAPDEVEFHEVGALDAIGDVVGVCLALEDLGIDQICAGTVNPGRGHVRCAHGLMPVPVPAVVELLRNSAWPTQIPTADTGELTTPTGMALLVGLGQPATAVPSGHVIAAGFGAGHKLIPGLVNACRCLIIASEAPPKRTDNIGSDQVCELTTQIDDASGEELAGLADALMAIGARDAWLTTVQMKKSRPGVMVSVLVDPAERERIAAWILTNTPAIGLRWSLIERMILPRRSAVVTVHGHAITLKIVTAPDGRERAKPERDQVLAAAAALALPPAEVARLAVNAWL